MRPWRLAEGLVLAGREIWIVVELIVPEHVIVSAVVDLIEGCADRIFRGVADADISRPQGRMAFVRKHELLAEIFRIGLRRAAKQARSCCAPALRKRFGAQFEREPPVD